MVVMRIPSSSKTIASTRVASDIFRESKPQNYSSIDTSACEAICQAVRDFFDTKGVDTRQTLLGLICQYVEHNDSKPRAKSAFMVRKNGERERFLKLDEVEERTGFRKSSIYKWMHEDGFPKPVKFGRSTRWVETEIDQWIKRNVKR